MRENESRFEGDEIPNFRGRPCLWDKLGLDRETDKSNQSSNRDDFPVHLQDVDFSDYRYLDAIQCPSGLLDREMGLVARHFPDREFSWFSVARQWRMRDIMILVFETTRTRSIDTVDLPGKHELRNQYHSENLAVAARAQEYLVSWSSGLREDTVPSIEAVLGRPYYELMLIDADDAALNISVSADAAAQDIIGESLKLMRTLHVRPYLFWTSETELMIAAGRPSSDTGPWSRADIDEMTFLPSILNGLLDSNISPDLMDWSNARRIVFEPACTKNVVDEDDTRLKGLLNDMQFLRRVIIPDSWSDDDEVLISRLVKLGRFGYGLPEVRKPEYRDVHIIDP